MTPPDDLSETIEWERPATGDGDASPAGAQEGKQQQPRASSEPIPERIGRYAVKSLLGEGTSGRVFLAYDEGLHRRVAIKAPRRELVSHTDQAERYREEARILAGLDHPHVVPVYDIGSTDQFPCYIVYKFIEGQDLGAMIRRGAPPYHRSARLVAAIGDALHAAHQHGLVHRDVKPGNILLDEDGRPYLADFGLALRDEDAGTGVTWAGTPDYMSPEQASGELVRLDGRSDIFSLGVVFYQLLTGTLPFQGRSFPEIAEKIMAADVRPPRQLDDRIPRAYEGICLKAMSRSKADRYTTALDMMEELEAISTYEPQPIDVSGVELSDRLRDLVERLARSNHDVWAAQRIEEGWQVGDIRDDKRKTHPDLTPYEQMSETEKEYDRRTVRTLLKSIVALGYRIQPGESTAPPTT